MRCSGWGCPANRISSSSLDSSFTPVAAPGQPGRFCLDCWTFCVLCRREHWLVWLQRHSMTSCGLEHSFWPSMGLSGCDQRLLQGWGRPVTRQGVLLVCLPWAHKWVGSLDNIHESFNLLVPVRLWAQIVLKLPLVQGVNLYFKSLNFMLIQ